MSISEQQIFLQQLRMFKTATDNPSSDIHRTEFFESKFR